MKKNLATMVNDPSPIHPNTMLELIEAVMIQEGGEDHPWIPGATAKPLLAKLRATIKQERSLVAAANSIDAESASATFSCGITRRRRENERDTDTQ